MGDFLRFQLLARLLNLVREQGAKPKEHPRLSLFHSLREKQHVFASPVCSRLQAKPIEELAKSYKTDLKKGLSSKKAAALGRQINTIACSHTTSRAFLAGSRGFSLQRGQTQKRRRHMVHAKHSLALTRERQIQNTGLDC